MNEIEKGMKAWRQDADFFRNAIEQARAMVLGIELDGTIRYANESAIQTYGYSPEEFCGLHINELRAPEAVGLLEEQFQEAKKTGIFFRTLHVNKAGYIFPVEVNSRQVDLSSGKMVVSIIHDVSDKARLEKTARESRAFSDYLVRAANVIILALDRECRIRLFNDASSQITGYTAAEALGKDAIDLLIPLENAAALRQYFHSTLCEGYLGEHENPILTKSGQLRFIRWQNCTTSEQGEVSGRLCFGIDITERQETLEVLQRKENFIHGVVEGLLFPFFVLDRNYCYLAFNEIHRQGVKILFNAEIKRGDNILDYHRDPETRRQARENFDRALAGESCVVEHLVGDPQYHTKRVLLEHNPVRDLDGNVIGVVVVSHDTTQLRRAEAEAQAAGERYRKLFEEAPAILLTVNAAGIIKYINAFGAKIFQFEREELADKPVEGTILPEIESTGRNLWRIYRDLWSGPFRDFRQTNENITRKGRRLWIDWTIREGVSPVTGEQGWFCMGVDVTAKQRIMTLEKFKIERKRTNEIMNDILFGRLSAVKAGEWLLKQGVNTERKLLCFALSARGDDEAESALQERQARDLLVEKCRAVSGGIAWETSGYIGILLSGKEGEAKKKYGLEEQAAEVWRKLQQYGCEELVGSGVAIKRNSGMSLAELFSQARHALEFGPYVHPNQTLFFWRDLGWLRLLIHHAQTPDACQYVQDHIGPLLTLPGAEKREALMETLKLAVSGKSTEEISKQMNIHKQTVRYRLTLLAKILELDGLNGEKAMNTAIALRIYEMQQHHGSERGY